MNPPMVNSSDKSVQQQAEVQEAKRRAENAKKAKETADQLFPNEKWVQVENGIYISSRRNLDETVSKNELRDAQILRNSGSTVYLVPHFSRSKTTQYDAIANGMKMELKNVNGNPGSLESAFLKSRSQAPNAFFNLENSNMTRSEAVAALYRARNSVTRTEKNGKVRKGYAELNEFKGGRVILKLKDYQNMIYLNVDDLKAH